MIFNTTLAEKSRSDQGKGSWFRYRNSKDKNIEQWREMKWCTNGWMDETNGWNEWMNRWNETGWIIDVSLKDESVIHVLLTFPCQNNYSQNCCLKKLILLNNDT